MIVNYCTHPLHPGPISEEKWERKHHCIHKLKARHGRIHHERCPWYELREKTNQ